jgi:hypothetical protein
VTDRWRHDRTGEVVADDREVPPRPAAGSTLTKGRAAVFEVSASWIGEDGRIHGAFREAHDQAELRAVIDTLRVAHGGRESFTFDVDVIEARGYRRSLSTHERDAADQRAALAEVRAAMRNGPSDPPVLADGEQLDLNEPF